MATKLTLESLEILDTIDKKGSFAAAAAALYRVPSAITYSMQKLEEDLGVVIFQKVGRKSVLTPAGKVLLEEGREILEAAVRLVETTRQTSVGWESSINIAIDSILDTSLLFSYIDELYKYSPNIEVNMYSEVLGGTIESIVEGRVDLVLGAANFSVRGTGLRIEEMAKIRWHFAVSKDHPLIDLQRTLTKQDIQEYRAVVLRDSSRHLPPISHRIFNKQQIIRVADMQHKIKAQVQGLGVGFLPEQRIKHLVESGELVCIPFETELTDVSANMAWNQNNKGKALHYLISSIKRNPRKLLGLD